MKPTTKSPQFIKNYKAGKIETIAIESITGFRKWYSTQQENVWKSGLLADNRERFTKLFGPCCHTFQGEFKYNNYYFEHDNQTFLVATAKGKGTRCELLLSGNAQSFDAIVKNDQLAETSINFLSTFMQTIGDSPRSIKALANKERSEPAKETETDNEVEVF